MFGKLLSTRVIVVHLATCGVSKTLFFVNKAIDCMPVTSVIFFFKEINYMFCCYASLCVLCSLSERRHLSVDLVVDRVGRSD